MALGRGKHESADERWLEVDASMTGTLTFKDPVNLQINGQFEGTLQTKGNLLVGPKARVNATITGDTITIGGTLEGTVSATARIELQASARVTGKISTPRLTVHEGAILHGSVEMVAQTTPGSRGWMSLEELASYLEVESGTVIEWAKTGRLPAQQDNGTWRFDRARIEEWLAHEKIK
ncbi:MAG: polymer-forming cytoskeletal protein [Candidatus Omnitrophica bacterium]|nr:polymer-forming cytoskeletal protein [Candidatus Omnitrophota bacterium]